MPCERCGVRAPVGRNRRCDGLSVKLIILSTVFEFFFDPTADIEPQIRRDGDVAAIKQCMYIAAQEQPVCAVMRATLSKGLDVRRFKRGQRTLACNHAAASISVG